MRDVIVVGGGVAGLQAAIVTAKAGADTLVLDAGDSWVTNTENVRNLLGFDAVAGTDLLATGRDQLDAFGGDHRTALVEEVERTDDGFRVETEDDRYEARYLILASAGDVAYADALDLSFEDGVEGQYYLERHVATDDHNRAADGVYVAGLARTWEYQVSIAIGDGARAAVNLLADDRGEPYMDHDV